MFYTPFYLLRQPHRAPAKSEGGKGETDCRETDDRTKKAKSSREPLNQIQNEIPTWFLK